MIGATLKVASFSRFIDVSSWHVEKFVSKRDIRTLAKVGYYIQWRTGSEFLTGHEELRRAQVGTV